MKNKFRLLLVVALLCFTAVGEGKPTSTGGNQQYASVVRVPTTGGPLKPSIEEWWPRLCWFYWPKARATCQER